MRNLEQTIRKILTEQQLFVGSYKTKYFHISPEATDLYTNKLDDTIDSHQAEKLAILHDKLFAIIHHIRRTGTSTPVDVTYSKELQKHIEHLAKTIGLSAQHSYVKKYVDEIANPSSALFTEPTRSVGQGKTRKDFKVSNNRKMHVKSKIIDESARKITLESLIRRKMFKHE